MAIERTLCIIKPDAVAKRKAGAILQHVLEEGFNVLGMRQQQLSKREAEGFYAVHRERPFFKDLCEFMCSGPVVVVALERENAVAHWRKVIGATDPAKADAGTIRADFADSIDANAVHGSDGPETARTEIAYFFPALEVFAR
jgi:nucleoside-diphosphate kinase